MKDAIVAQPEDLDPDDAKRADALIEQHLPASLRDAAGSAAIASLPKAYFHRVVASVLAGEIVYREGIDYLNEISPERLGTLAMQYLHPIEETRTLIAQLAASDLTGIAGSPNSWSRVVCGRAWAWTPESTQQVRKTSGIQEERQRMTQDLLGSLMWGLKQGTIALNTVGATRAIFSHQLATFPLCFQDTIASPSLRETGWQCRPAGTRFASRACPGHALRCHRSESSGRKSR